MLPNLKLLFSLILAVLISVFSSRAAGTTFEIPYPDQYFEISNADFREYRENYWHTLFPQKPEFKYAFLFVPCFTGRDMGFYLDKNDLYWAKGSDDFCLSTLKSKPAIEFPDKCFSLLLSHCISPLTHRLRIWFLEKVFLQEKNLDVIYSKKYNVFTIPDYIQRKFQTHINQFLYIHHFIQRGKIELDGELSQELRKTWDLAVTKRTFPMSLYYEFISMLDGEYAYFRGGSGVIGEDILQGKSKMRQEMMKLSLALMNMDSLKESKKNGILVKEHCRNIQKYALALGDSPPPMNSTEWVNDFLERYSKHQEAEASAKTIPPHTINSTPVLK